MVCPEVSPRYSWSPSSPRYARTANIFAVCPRTLRGMIRSPSRGLRAVPSRCSPFYTRNPGQFAVCPVLSTEFSAVCSISGAHCDMPDSAGSSQYIPTDPTPNPELYVMHLIPRARRYISRPSRVLGVMLPPGGGAIHDKSKTVPF